MKLKKKKILAIFLYEIKKISTRYPQWVPCRNHCTGKTVGKKIRENTGNLEIWPKHMEKHKELGLLNL